MTVPKMFQTQLIQSKASHLIIFALAKNKKSIKHDFESAWKLI